MKAVDQSLPKSQTDDLGTFWPRATRGNLHYASLRAGRLKLDDAKPR